MRALSTFISMSWKVAIYYINRALLIPNRAALYTSDCVTMWIITEKDTGIASLKSNAVWHNRSGTCHFWKRVLISPYMTNSAIYPSLKSKKTIKCPENIHVYLGNLFFLLFLLSSENQRIWWLQSICKPIAKLCAV